MWIVDKAWQFHDFWKRCEPLLEKEAKFPTDLPFHKRVRMWTRGFLSQSYFVYDFQKHDPLVYLTDGQRFLKTPLIDRPYHLILDNKIVFPRMFQDYHAQAVQNFYVYRRNRFARLDLTLPEPVTVEAVLEAMEEKGRFVSKPVARGGGVRINVTHFDPETGVIRINGREASRNELEKILLDPRGSIICEFVEQAEYARRVFPDSTNSIRIVTMWDYEEEQPFIATAVHRFGIRDTAPVDNWTQGGLSAAIDLESGRLGPGIAFPKEKKREFRDRHPDSGEVINGLTVANWAKVREGILDMALRIPFCPYVGWDVVVTDDAFKVLEGNSYTDVNLLQIHRPLLEDERVRRFYKHHSVI